MAVQDLWTKKDGTPSARHGRGKRWRVSVDGYPTSAYRTRAQADKVNAERIAAGPPHADAEITVGVLLDQWLAGKKGKAPDTVRAATSTHARVHAYWANHIAAGVRRPDVVAWLAEMTVTPRSGGAEGTTRAGASIAVDEGQELAGPVGCF